MLSMGRREGGEEGGCPGGGGEMGLDMWAAGGWTDCFQLLLYCLTYYTTNTRDACS